MQQRAASDTSAPGEWARAVAIAWSGIKDWMIRVVGGSVTPLLSDRDR